MSTVFAKLNLKDQPEIVVLQAPPSFESELNQVDARIARDLKQAKSIEFCLAFVTRKDEVEALAPAIAKKAQGDAVVWFAYPKGTSKNYKSDIKRDNSWNAMGEQGFEPVRMVAIDQDWSALRFRRAEFIKNMTRAQEHRLSGRKK